MKHIFALLIIIATTFLHAQTVLTVGPVSTYPTVSAAYAAIPSTISGAYIIELQTGYNSLAEAFPITMGLKNGASATNTITIRPGVSGRSIASANADATIKINGGRYIVIDGRVNGQGPVDLSIVNSNVLGNAVEYTNGASDNLCNYASLVGVSDSGVVHFNGRGNTTGVDRNTVSNCDISGYSSLGACMVAMTSASGINNDNNKILACNLAYTVLNSGTHRSVFISDNQKTFIFRNNSFYEPDSVTVDNYHWFFYVTGAGTNGTIDSNYFGGIEAKCGGTAMKISQKRTTATSLIFFGFEDGINSSNTQCVITNNVIRNMQINADGYILKQTYTGNHNHTLTGNVVGDISGATPTRFSGRTFEGFFAVVNTPVQGNVFAYTQITSQNSTALFYAGWLYFNRVQNCKISGGTTTLFKAEIKVNGNSLSGSYIDASDLYIFRSDSVTSNTAQNDTFVATTIAITRTQSSSTYVMKAVLNNTFENIVANDFSAVVADLSSNAANIRVPVFIDGNRFKNISYQKFSGVTIPRYMLDKWPSYSVSHNVFSNIRPDSTLISTGIPGALPLRFINITQLYNKAIIIGNVIDSVRQSNSFTSTYDSEISAIYINTSGNNSAVKDSTTVRCNKISNFRFTGRNLNSPINSPVPRTFLGIYVNPEDPEYLNVSDNEISNIIQAGSAQGAIIKAIVTDIDEQIVYSESITDRNLIHDIYVNDSMIYLPGENVVIQGISATLTAYTTTRTSVSDNIIYNMGYLKGNNIACGIEGIRMQTDSNATCSRNWISNLENRSVSNKAGIYGINYYWGTFANNIIALGKDKDGNDITSTASVFGMCGRRPSYVFTKFLFNTITLTGAVTNNSRSACIFDTSDAVNSPDEFFIILNNVFNNSRYNASFPNNNLCFYLPSVINTTIDVNDYYKNGNTGLGTFNMGQTILNTLANVRSAIIGQNVGSISADPLLVSPAATYALTNVAPQPASPLLLGGFALSAVKTDYYGVNRRAIPTIGAVETPGFAAPLITAQDVPCIPGSNTGSILIEQAVPVKWSNYKLYATTNTLLKSGSISASPFTVTSLGTAEYVLRLYAANGDSLTRTVTVCRAAEATLNYAAAIQGGCGVQGSITLTATGGTAPYLYTGPSSNNTGAFANLAPGTYNFTISSAEGCRTNATVTLGGGTIAISTDSLIANTHCTVPNGRVNIIASGGVTPYSYNFNGQLNTTGKFSNLANGNYQVTVTDNAGCSSTISVTITDGRPVLTATISPTAQTNCGAPNGSATVIATGGDGNFSYVWNVAGSTATISNLIAGNYTVTVTDGNNCSVLKNVSVANNTPVISTAMSSSPTTSCANPNGTATVNATGGGGNLIYAWSVPGTLATITSLAAGNYSVTVTDANSCSASASVSVAANTPVITATTTSTAVTHCTVPNGTATVSASGGAGNYTYSWSVSGTLATISNLSSGAYTVTVTDANSCSGVASVTVALNLPVIVTTTNSTPVTSCVTANGTAIVNATGGNGSYSYIWVNNNTTQTADSLAAGTYTVTVTDGNGCTGAGNVTVGDNKPVISGTATATAVTNCSTPNGTATVNATGGSGNYTYLWANNTTTQTTDSMAPGNYMVTVTDANNCSTVISVTVNDNKPQIIITEQIQANTGCITYTGSIGLTVNGGQGSYQYVWSTPGNLGVASNLNGGNYSVSVTDANGCSATSLFTVTNQLPAINPGVTTTNETSAGLNNGTAAANPTGGALPYTYNWSNTLQTDSIADLAPGTYAVTVTDANGCSAVSNFSIQASPVSIGKNIKAITFNIFPNPANRQISVALSSYNSQQGDEIKIIDMVGVAEKVEIPYGKAILPLNIDKYVAGVYYMVLVRDKQIIATAKFVKID